MRHHMSADGLASISAGEECGCAWVRLDLIRDEDCDVELLGHVCQAPKMLSKLRLAFLKLASTDVVHTEQSADLKKMISPAKTCPRSLGSIETSRGNDVVESSRLPSVYVPSR